VSLDHGASAPARSRGALALDRTPDGAGAPRGRAPRQDRACQTSLQRSEIESVQPNGVGTQRATILVYFEK